MHHPGFVFTALSYFSWVCWIAPRNNVVNQLFGVSTGLGMGLLTFDWTQVTWIGNPLTTPWWAEVNVGIGFVVFYWILTPILYYTNVRLGTRWIMIIRTLTFFAGVAYCIPSYQCYSSC